MPNFHIALEKMAKLEEMKHTLPNALEDMANELIEGFDETGYMSDFGLETVDDLIRRKK